MKEFWNAILMITGKYALTTKTLEEQHQTRGDFMIRIIGHTTLKVHQGTGSGLTEITPDPAR